MAEEIESPESGTDAAGNADPIALERLAGAAAISRDMAAMAWGESGLATLGYLHEMTVSDRESGKADFSNAGVKYSSLNVRSTGQRANFLLSRPG